MVLGKDEEGDGELDGDEEGRSVPFDEKPREEREADGAEDGGQRYVTRDGEDDQEDGDGCDGSPGGGDEEDAEAGGYSLASAKTEPDGEHVAKDSEEGGEGLHVAQVG